MPFVAMHPAGEVVAYDCDDHSEIAQVPVGGNVTNIAVDEANRRLFYTRYTTNNPFHDELAVVDTSMLLAPNPKPTARVTLPLRSRPTRVVYDPGADRAYVMAQGAVGVGQPGIVEVDLATNTATHVITQGGPVALDIDGSTGCSSSGSRTGWPPSTPPPAP
jgi:hypothetical protein